MAGVVACHCAGREDEVVSCALALFEELAPGVAIGATAFNATLLSYRGSMDIGLNIDGAAIDEPDLLRQCVVDAIDDLIAAAK